MPRFRPRFFAPPVLLVLVSVILPGCGHDSCDTPDCYPPPAYAPQTSENNVLHNFQQAYRDRNMDEYAKLFAEDALYYYDPDTRATKGLPEFRNRFTDSTETAALLLSPGVTDVGLTLEYPGQTLPVNERGRERWTMIPNVRLFLETGYLPGPHCPDGCTVRTDRTQTFYFRKGRTEADTLASSRTSSTVYIVERREPGVLAPGVTGE